MKLPKKAIKTATYLSGIFAIACAGLLVYFLAMSLLGLMHPRTRNITLVTEDVTKIFDGCSLTCGDIRIYGADLHDEHELVITGRNEITYVGEIPNAPKYRIVDDTGADVTKYYDITEKFGTLTVYPRPITLFTISKTQRYTGEALIADKPILTRGSIAVGHNLEFGEANQLIAPGTLKNTFDYRIVDEYGIDRTDQYTVSEMLGDLTVLPIPLYLRTDPAKKTYDGTPLQESGWRFESGTLLEGHNLSAETISVIQEVGTCENALHCTVTAADGTDMTHLYEFNVTAGLLEILPMPLYITTGSAEKMYDGTPLTCEEWELTGGTLEPGATLVCVGPNSLNTVGTTENTMRFQVLDSNGIDISHRYGFICNNGTLNIQPRPMTIRTGSAEKIYDGDPLICTDYEFLNGSLLPGDELYLDTYALWEVGYSDNYVLFCMIVRKENGTETDVTHLYRITYQYGILKIHPN